MNSSPTSPIRQPMARAASTTTSYLHELRLITMRRWFFLRLLRRGERRGAVRGEGCGGVVGGGGVGVRLALERHVGIPGSTAALCGAPRGRG